MHEFFDILNWMVMVFSKEVLHIFQLAVWLTVSVIWNTSERTIIHWFEISVSSVSSIMNMTFFETSLGSEGLICVGRIAYFLMNAVLEYHYFSNIIYN
jgi:hypothetical protein